MYCIRKISFVILLGIHWRMFANVRDGKTFLGTVQHGMVVIGALASICKRVITVKKRRVAVRATTGAGHGPRLALALQGFSLGRIPAPTYAIWFTRYVGWGATG